MAKPARPANPAAAPNTRAIAAACGVSHVTVSRALRDSPNVSPDTKGRVLAAARRLGYKPNPLVQAFAARIRQGRPVPAATGCNLAWLVSEPAPHPEVRPWLVPCLAGARRRARELGFTLDTTVNAHGLSDSRLAGILDSRGIRGVLLPHAGFFDREPFHGANLVTVGIDENTTGAAMHTVAPDYFRNLTLAFDELHALGYRRIGFCEHVFSVVLSQGGLWGGFLWNQQRLPVADRLPPLTGLRPVAGKHQGERDRFLRWLDELRPDAVLSTFFQVNDWLRHSGRSVPRDIGLAHLGLLDAHADWSGIDYREAEIGAAAVDLASAHLLRNESGMPVTPKFVRLPGRWHAGSTTRAPASSTASTRAPLAHDYAWFAQNFF
jgi:DNA-binding LacI/PurR family transcriptional regulator